MRKRQSKTKRDCAVFGLLVVGLIVTHPNPANAAPPIVAVKPIRSDIDRWIDNLSHPSADLRQIATRKLVNAGRTALPAVAAAISHRNPETAARSRLILLRMCLAKDIETSKAAVDVVVLLSKRKSAGLRRWSSNLLKRLEVFAEATLKDGGVAVTMRIDSEGRDVARVDMSKWNGHDRSLITLRFLGRIEAIDLSKSKISDASLRWLREHRTLRILELRSTPIGDDGLQHLAGLTELTELDLRETNVTANGLKHLSRLKKLRSLHLGETQFADGDLRFLPNSAGLRYLNLSTAKLKDADLAVIKNCRALEELWISHTNIGDAGLVHLRDLPKLRLLGLSGCNVTDAGLKSLYNLKSLKKLWLTRAPVTSGGVQALQKRLPDVEVRR